MTSFLGSLARVALALAVAGAAGLAATPALFPRGRATALAERLGWGFAIGCALLAAAVPLALTVGLTPGWLSFLTLAALAVAAGFGFRVSSLESKANAGEPETRNPRLETSALLLGALIAAGLALYALRALTEPMWSNDFLAIWGLKGKTIFFTGALPAGFPAFSHPEYPLGLPLVYAGLAALSGGWDDQAMALLFPFLQAATLGVLLGWLRRRGARLPLALATAALLAFFEPLYSAFLTGMADIPLAFALLLFGTALADGLEGTADSAPLRRLAVSSALLAAVKNEGLFLGAAGFAIALLWGGSRRVRLAAAALAPALAVYGLHLAWRGRLPLSDFDFALFSPARATEALGVAARVPGLAGWLGLAAVAVLVVAGRRDPGADAMLLLAGLGLFAYLVLPIFAVRGPAWLVGTTLARTASALVPLVAAGIGARLTERSKPTS